MTYYGQAFGKKMEFHSINGKENIQEIDWNANYDGNRANLSLNVNKNGKKTKHYNMRLNNRDLEKLLNVPMDNTPLKQRLIRDLNTCIPDYPVIEFDLQKSDLLPHKKTKKRRNKKSSSSSKKTKTNHKQ